MAAPMPFCKSDGSAADGDVAPISGLGTFGDLGGGSTWNASTCKIQANTFTEADDKAFTADVINYIKSPDTSRLTGLYTRLGNR